MRYLFEYRTADNVRHSGEVEARSREDAYAVLKSRAIRPSRLEEAPGFFNKLFGKGKRWLAIVALAVVAAGLFIKLMRDDPAVGGWEDMLDSPVRRQIVGETAIVEHGIRTGWASVFSDEAERFLASFAVPGASPAIRTTTQDKLVSSFSRHILSEQTDSIETRQIKAVVEGMKREAKSYFEAGGSFEKYLKRLFRRQREEIGYYVQISNELHQANSRGLPKKELEDLWERRNVSLGNMGIKLVPLPE